MKRNLIFIVLSLVVVTAGCIDNSEDRSKTNEFAENTDETSSSLSQSQFSFNEEMQEVVLRLSDFDGKYDFSSEMNETREGLSDSRKKTFEDKGVLGQYKRLFTREEAESGVPYQIISTATVYENSENANSDLDSSLQEIRDKNGEVEERDIAGVSVYKAIWDDSQGYSHTVIYRQEDNLLYFVFSTERENRSYDEKMELLMEEMISDVER